jgi:ABC-type Na+ efflux pump permease subunit
VGCVKAWRLSQLDVWPVAQRELREGARRPVNHRLRVLSASVATLLLWVMAANLRLPPAQMGRWLFAGLHTLLLGLIALIVPALTADCIAREKREGTLGLLFLTPLSAGGIVAGKALAQALRALSLWLAALPILAIPFMTGGVIWFDVFSALSLEFSGAVVCLAAGLFASSLARGRNMAFLLAFFLGAMWLLLFIQLFQLILLVSWRGLAVLQQADAEEFFLDDIRLFFGTTLGTTVGFVGWNSQTMVLPGLGKIWLWLCLASPPVSLLFFYAVARFAARRVERSWQDKVPSGRREGLLRRYCAPLLRRRYHRKSQRTLDWNPIAWLQQHSWKARSSKWGLCFFFLLVESALPGGSDGEWFQAPLLFVLGGIYSFIGVSGFLEEKRSGALELLLITPISVNKLIFGRAWGLWKQFLPAALVLLVFHEIWIYTDQSGYDFGYEAVQIPFMLACCFLTLPVFATYFALRVKNLIVAALLTWVALWVPFMFSMECNALGGDSNEIDLPLALLFFVTYLFCALLACSLLRHSLSRRIYSF